MEIIYLLIPLSMFPQIVVIYVITHYAIFKLNTFIIGRRTATPDLDSLSQ
jgi:hypothetical protein